MDCTALVKRLVKLTPYSTTTSAPQLDARIVDQKVLCSLQLQRNQQQIQKRKDRYSPVAPTCISERLRRSHTSRCHLAAYVSTILSLLTYLYYYYYYYQSTLNLIICGCASPLSRTTYVVRAVSSFFPLSSFSVWSH